MSELLNQAASELAAIDEFLPAPHPGQGARRENAEARLQYVQVKVLIAIALALESIDETLSLRI